VGREEGDIFSARILISLGQQFWNNSPHNNFILFASFLSARCYTLLYLHPGAPRPPCTERLFLRRRHRAVRQTPRPQRRTRLLPAAACPARQQLSAWRSGTAALVGTVRRPRVSDAQRTDICFLTRKSRRLQNNRVNLIWWIGHCRTNIDTFSNFLQIIYCKAFLGWRVTVLQTAAAPHFVTAQPVNSPWSFPTGTVQPLGSHRHRKPKSTTNLTNGWRILLLFN